MNPTTLTAIATACGTFVVVILQGVNLKDTADVKADAEVTSSEVRTVIEQNREGLERQKALLKAMEELEKQFHK